MYKVLILLTIGCWVIHDQSLLVLLVSVLLKERNQSNDSWLEYCKYDFLVV